MTKEISAKEVELYLLKNTDFFLTRESIVSELNFKHSPGKAESLLERQVRKLRSEQKDLLDSLSVFLSNASENEDLFSKSKALVLKVVTAEDEDKKKELIQVEVLPKKLDEEVASLMVQGFGGVVTKLTEEQADYINVPQDGPFKEDSYKY